MALSTSQISEIKKVINDFLDHHGSDESEAHVESSYTLEILKILGWSSKNWKINTPQERKTGKRPDILLKGFGGGTIFIIESKEPKVHNGLDGRYPKMTFVQQLCNYCGGEGLMWGALTNFQEWRILNTNAYSLQQSFFKKLTIIEKEKVVCSDSQLNDFFSHLTNAFLNAQRGKISTDDIYYKAQEEIKDDFFKNLKQWRSSLRTAIFKKYRSLPPEEIDNQTQRILDRLIFIDVCYDKEIISQDYLGSILFSKKPFYSELKTIFRQLDEKFNSEIFSIDKCDEFEIDNDEIENIISGINHIDFSRIDVHVIGEVYENYLGELLKAGKQKITSVESKESAKRKLHGIYYTPDYIVNYIIKHTVAGVLDKCHTEGEIEKIRVLDIACGSGSFLIKAFDLFYQAYKRVNNKRQFGIFDELNIRKKILLHNLFGVDLDERAVEIAKLNLLLKALEGLQESYVSGRKILPNLSLNIRCGNSLISGKYEDEENPNTNGPQLSFLFDRKSDYKDDITRLLELKNEFYANEDNEGKGKTLAKIFHLEAKIDKYINADLKNYFKNIELVKPFNYEVAFCEVMRTGGFNCVIGNPPYKMFSRVTGSSAKSYSEEEKHYLNDTYINSAEYKLSTYIIFSNRALSLLCESGRFGYILPDSYILGYYFSKFRNYLLSKYHINQIAIIKEDFWKQASVGFPSILIASKEGGKSLKSVEANTLKDFITGQTRSFTISQNYYKSIPRFKFRLYYNQFEKDIIEKIEKGKQSLENVVKIQVGIRPKVEQEKIISTKAKNHLWKKGLIDGDEVTRYRINYKGNFIHVDEKLLWGGGFDKHKIENRKLLIRKTGDRIIATLDEDGYYHLDNLHFCSLINPNYSLKFLLGILNSSLFKYYYRATSMEKGRAMAQTDIDTLHNLKIPILNFKKKKDKDIEKKMSGLVDEMLLLNKDPEKNKNAIKTLDSEIDDLVFKLYGINNSERNTIESYIE